MIRGAAIDLAPKDLLKPELEALEAKYKGQGGAVRLCWRILIIVFG
jgi:hypothetical protein